MGAGELELIQRALHGDVDAWGEIVRRYKDAVFGIALGILGNPADAEDAAHDAFIRAYEGLHTFHLEKRFSTWIFAVTANVCKNKLRRERLFAPLKHLSRLTKGSDPAQAARAARAHPASIREAIDQLKPAYRDALGAALLRRFGLQRDRRGLWGCPKGP
jgi:RNA polymerase sigma-70 factor (ECF subfamily)